MVELTKERLADLRLIPVAAVTYTEMIALIDAAEELDQLRAENAALRLRAEKAERDLAVLEGWIPEEDTNQLHCVCGCRFLVHSRNGCTRCSADDCPGFVDARVGIAGSSCFYCREPIGDQSWMYVHGRLRLAHGDCWTKAHVAAQAKGAER